MRFHAVVLVLKAITQLRARYILEQVVALGWRHPAWLERDPDFDTLRSHPRFKRIARAIESAN